MYRTKKELRIMHRLSEQRISVLEGRLQAARDVNFELREDLSALQAQLDALSAPDPARGTKPCSQDGIVIVLL